MACAIASSVATIWPREATEQRLATFAVQSNLHFVEYESGAAFQPLMQKAWSVPPVEHATGMAPLSEFNTSIPLSLPDVLIIVRS